MDVPKNFGRKLNLFIFNILKICSNLRVPGSESLTPALFAINIGHPLCDRRGIIQTNLNFVTITASDIVVKKNHRISLQEP